MFSPPLARFLSRDPLPINGQADIFFDNNGFGDWLTLMRNLYGYVSNNSLNAVDPSGLAMYTVTPLNVNAIRRYPQQLLDYYRRIMREIVVVSDALWRGGSGAMQELRSPYNNCACHISNKRGGSGGLYSQISSAAARHPFPTQWPKLKQVIEYSWGNYDTVGYFGVRFVDGSSYNVPGIPGINIDSNQFFGGSVVDALTILIHEPQHDLGQNTFLGLGFGHNQMNQIIGPYSGKNEFSELIDFLKNAKCGSNSIWELIVQQAGTKPQKPIPLYPRGTLVRYLRGPYRIAE